MTWNSRLVGKDTKSFKLILKQSCGSPLLLFGPPWQIYDNECGLAQLVRWSEDHRCRMVLFVRVLDGLIVGEWREYHQVWGSVPFVLEGRSRMLEYLKKAASKATSTPLELEVTDEEFAKKWPALYCFLSANVTADGELRERCKVQVFAEGGSWKACLMDPGNEASLFVTLPTPTKAFDALEKALGHDKVDWRVWRKNRKKG